MLTSSKIGKQNGDTRTRKQESGYRNLSNVTAETGLQCICVYIHASLLK